MFVQFWMAKSPIVATEETSLEEALYLMQRSGIRRLPVVRGENELCGIVALSDIYPFIGPQGMTKARLPEAVAEQLQKVRVASVMTRSPVTCSRHATIDEIGVIMRQKKIGAVPVVEGTKVVGIITESDILGALSSIAHVGSESERIIFRVPVMDKGKTFYKVISLCEKYELETLTILIHPIPEEKRHLVMLRVRGKKIPDFIDMLWKHHYDVLVTSL